jgi:hypothetical protein
MIATGRMPAGALHEIMPVLHRFCIILSLIFSIACTVLNSWISSRIRIINQRLIMHPYAPVIKQRKKVRREKIDLRSKTSTSVGMKFFKGIDLFVKNNITGNIHTPCRDV